MKKPQLTFRSSVAPIPTTRIYVGEELLKGDLLQTLSRSFSEPPVVVGDKTCQALYEKQIISSLAQATWLQIPVGEQAKTEKAQRALVGQLFHQKVGKNGVLIAVGGGAALDLVGFVASIYLRGIGLILVPTTLLAMVDSTIGGKTAINTPLGKNLLGTFYPPQAVIADLSTLTTLPEKEWLHGLAEILKLGLVADASLWQQAKERLAIKKTKDRSLILQAMKGKIRIIEQDPRDTGLRRILNFGHTLGHGFEQVSLYTLAHGEAVALGSLGEAHLSWKLGYLSEAEFRKIETVYRSFAFQLPKGCCREALFEAMSHDKKRDPQGGFRFVLIDRIGHAMPFENHWCRTVSKKELEPTLEWMERNYGRLVH